MRERLQGSVISILSPESVRRCAYQNLDSGRATRGGHWSSLGGCGQPPWPCGRRAGGGANGSHHSSLLVLPIGQTHVKIERKEDHMISTGQSSKTAGHRRVEAQKRSFAHRVSRTILNMSSSLCKFFLSDWWAVDVKNLTKSSYSAREEWVCTGIWKHFFFRTMCKFSWQFVSHYCLLCPSRSIKIMPNKTFPKLVLDFSSQLFFRTEMFR